jgi:RNA polymerase sigma factor (sigma-70 family)
MLAHKLSLSALNNDLNDKHKYQKSPETKEFKTKRASPYLRSDGLAWQLFDPHLKIILCYVDIVRYQVGRFVIHANVDDLHELYQEGLLTLWELILSHRDFESSNADFTWLVKRHVNSRLKRLRREQWKISKVSNKLLEQDICVSTLPKEEEIEADLNKNCIHRALDRLKPKESFAILVKFGVFSDCAVDSQVREIRLSPRSINRHSKNALVTLSLDPDVRSLNP